MHSEGWEIFKAQSELGYSITMGKGCRQQHPVRSGKDLEAVKMGLW